MKVKNKFLYIIMIITIIIGGVVIALKGFNYSLENSNHQRLEIILDSPYNEKEMKKIVKSVIKDAYMVRTSSLFETTVAIDSKDFSDEEIISIFGKINEKYGTNYSMKTIKLKNIIDEYELSNVSSMKDKEINEKIAQIKEKYNLEFTKEELADTSSIKADISNIIGIDIMDTVNKFMIPVIIAVVIILVYISLRGIKYDKLIAVKSLLKLIITEAFLVAVIAIIRLPLNSILITGLTVIGFAELVLFNVQNEKMITNKKEEKQ